MIVDKIFEISAEEAIFGPEIASNMEDQTFILPGLAQYRQKFNKGNTVFDFRLGYKINEKMRFGLIANNILNAEVTTRPGDIQPPRNFLVQLQMKL